MTAIRARLEAHKFDQRQLCDTESESFTAATEVHTGAMIALVPTDDDAQRIAMDGGEEPDDLHVTLMYLGEMASISSEVRNQLVEHIAAQVAELPAVTGKIFSVNVFNPEPGQSITASGDAPTPCVTWGVNGTALQDLHDDIVDGVSAVMSDAQLTTPEQHTPWIPHITATYISSDDEVDLSAFTDRVGSVTFDTVRLAFGDDVYDVPLGDIITEFDNSNEVVAAFDPHQPRDTEGKWTDVGASITHEVADAVPRVEINATPADMGNKDYEPGTTTIEAVSALRGRTVNVTTAWGGTAHTELTDVGTTQGGVRGIITRNSDVEMFLPWSMLRSVEDVAEQPVRDVPKTPAPETPYSAMFADMTSNARRGKAAMTAVPIISEDAPIEQHWALGSYETEGYGPVNSALRTGNRSLTVEQDRGVDDGVVSVSVNEAISDLDKLFARSTTSSDILTYRGVRLLKSLGVDTSTNLEGMEWRDPAYTSTSADRVRAVGFIDKRLGEGTNALLRVFVPKGMHAVNLGYDEQEVLLNRGARYKIISDNGVIDGVRQLDVEVVPGA